MVHLDVMDGSFVPNISFGSKMVADIREKTKLPLDVHLMINDPGRHVDDFIRAGADYLTFHLEAAVHSHRILQRIRSEGVKAGISIVPSTPASALSELIPSADLVLVMTVNPGFGGQKIIPECVSKIATVRAMLDAAGSRALLAVDGGVNRETADMVRRAGATLLVSGSSFFQASDPAAEVRILRGDLSV